MSNQEMIKQYWAHCGIASFSEYEIESALDSFKSALLCGQKIPRVDDKTLAPLYGPRLDIKLDNK